MHLGPVGLAVVDRRCHATGRVVEHSADNIDLDPEFSHARRSGPAKIVEAPVADAGEIVTPLLGAREPRDGPLAPARREHEIAGLAG